MDITGLEALRGLSKTPEGGLRLGAGETLHTLASSVAIRELAPALAEACGRVAHPQVRNMGTLGGNVCLDTRCRWVNRSYSWRSALGGCLKAEGSQCWVVERGKRCVAAASGDSLAPLVALGAQVEIAGPAGPRVIDVLDLRHKDGAAPLTLARGELVQTIHLPPPHQATSRRRSAYLRWARRRSIDFPLISVGLVLDEDERDAIASLEVVVTVLGPRPRRIKGLERFCGERLSPAVAAAVAEATNRQCTPLENVPFDAVWRRRALGVMVRRQLEGWAVRAADRPADPPRPSRSRP